MVHSVCIELQHVDLQYVNNYGHMITKDYIRILYMSVCRRNNMLFCGFLFPFALNQRIRCAIKEHYHSLIHLKESICHAKAYLATWHLAFEPTGSESNITLIECW